MLVGYGRTSTIEQMAGFESQLKELKDVGCGEIFSEQVSSVAKRPKLDEALTYVRKGDTLVVTKLDRLARSVKDLNDIVSRLTKKGVNLKILNIKIDTGTPTGRLMMNMLGAISEFERDLMLERQKEGIAKAKAEGKYKGRSATAMAKKKEVSSLLEQGFTANQVAAKLDIGVASVYRIKKVLSKEISA